MLPSFYFNLSAIWLLFEHCFVCNFFFYQAEQVGQIILSALQSLNSPFFSLPVAYIKPDNTHVSLVHRAREVYHFAGSQDQGSSGLSCGLGLQVRYRNGDVAVCDSAANAFHARGVRIRLTVSCMVIQRAVFRFVLSCASGHILHTFAAPVFGKRNHLISGRTAINDFFIAGEG